MIKFIAEFQDKIYNLITNLQLLTFTQQSELKVIILVNEFHLIIIFTYVAFEKN